MSVVLPRIQALEANSASQVDLQPTQLKNLLRRLEFFERSLQSSNIVIKGLPRTAENLMTDVQALLLTYFDLENAVTSVREVGNGPRKSIIATLKSPELKQLIMKSKYKLKQTKIFIDPHLTPNEQDIYNKARAKAAPYKQKGHKVMIGYSKYCVDGKWFHWNHVKEEFLERPSQSIGGLATAMETTPPSSQAKNG